jgi:hypothetical protein
MWIDRSGGSKVADLRSLSEAAEPEVLLTC